MDIVPNETDSAASSASNSKMPKLLKLGHSLSSGDHIPSNIHVIERPQDNGTEKCSSPCVKSTENFIIQNKTLGALKKQSSAFVSTSTTPESSPRQKYLMPAFQSMGKISLGKGSSYGSSAKDANNILSSTDKFILLMRQKQAEDQNGERKQDVPLLRVSSLENKKTSFVINPRATSKATLGSVNGVGSMNPQRVASPINVKSLDKSGERTPTQSNAGRSASTKGKASSNLGHLHAIAGKTRTALRTTPTSFIGQKIIFNRQRPK